MAAGASGLAYDGGARGHWRVRRHFVGNFTKGSYRTGRTVRHPGGAGTGRAGTGLHGRRALRCIRLQCDRKDVLLKDGAGGAVPVLYTFAGKRIRHRCEHVEYDRIFRYAAGTAGDFKFGGGEAAELCKEDLSGAGSAKKSIPEACGQLAGSIPGGGSKRYTGDCRDDRPDQADVRAVAGDERGAAGAGGFGCDLRHLSHIHDAYEPWLKLQVYAADQGLCDLPDAGKGRLFAAGRPDRRHQPSECTGTRADAGQSAGGISGGRLCRCKGRYGAA